MNPRRRRACVIAAVALAVALFVLVYRGPGWHVTRGHVGDGASAMFIMAVLAYAAPRIRVGVLAALGLLLCTLVELGQTLWSGIGDTPLGELVLGAVFDPVDLLAYAFGTAVAAIALACRPN